MPNDPLEPDTGNPPRTLEEWTRVKGHDVKVVGGRARCACGESQPVHDLLRPRVDPERELTPDQAAKVRKAARAWRDDHLRTTWPVLMPRLEGETPEVHAARVHAELVEARALRERLDDEMDSSGDVIPVVSQEQIDAGVRAAVLKHQYNELAEQLRRVHPTGSAGYARWAAEGYGDPLDEI